MNALFLLYFSIVYILVNVMPVLAVETRGIYASVLDTATNKSETIKLYNKAYAVIIGIDRYKNLKADKQLKYAVKDAQGIEATLTKHFKFDKIVTLYNENATRNRIMSLLLDELPMTIGMDDALFLFWAGHGNQKTTVDGDLGYLIPYDGNSDSTNGNITMGQLKDEISKTILAKHIFYTFDACYSGLLTTRSVDNKVVRNLDFLKKMTNGRVRQVLTAGSKGQLTLDEGSKGHSVFTGRLIEILETSGDYITANEIQVKLKELVYQDAQARGHEQIPSFGVLYGTGDFIFVPIIEQKEQDNRVELARTEAELKLLDEQEKLVRLRFELEKKRKSLASSSDSMQEAKSEIEPETKLDPNAIPPSAAIASVIKLSPAQNRANTEKKQQDNFNFKPKFVGRLGNGLVEFKKINWGDDHKFLVITYEVIADEFIPNSTSVEISCSDNDGRTEKWNEPFRGDIRRKGEVKDLIITLPMPSIKAEAKFY